MTIIVSFLSDRSVVSRKFCRVNHWMSPISGVRCANLFILSSITTLKQIDSCIAELEKSDATSLSLSLSLSLQPSKSQACDSEKIILKQNNAGEAKGYRVEVQHYWFAILSFSTRKLTAVE
jgi:hypothetical protein